MRPFFIALGAAAALGGLGGWLSAGGGGGGVRGDDTAWALNDRLPLGDAERLKLFTALMGTNHLGTERAVAENAPEEDENVAGVPRIAAAWTKDGRITLSIESGDSAYISAGIGDTLPGGWVVKDATLDRVTVERNGETVELTVFPHDNPGI